MPDPSGRITLDQVFLDTVEFSHRGDALSLPPNTPPTLGEVNVQVQVGRNADGTAGVLRVTVATKPENQPLYSVRLSMSAVCSVGPAPPDISDPVTMTVKAFLEGPAIGVLYPFVREAFANVTMRGRFGPVWLAPMNLKALADDLSKAAEVQVVPPRAEHPDPADNLSTKPKAKPAKRRAT